MSRLRENKPPAWRTGGTAWEEWSWESHLWSYQNLWGMLFECELFIGTMYLWLCSYAPKKVKSKRLFSFLDKRHSLYFLPSTKNCPKNPKSQHPTSAVVQATLYCWPWPLPSSQISGIAMAWSNKLRCHRFQGRFPPSLEWRNQWRATALGKMDGH